MGDPFPGADRVELPVHQAALLRRSARRRGAELGFVCLLPMAALSGGSSGFARAGSRSPLAHAGFEFLADVDHRQVIERELQKHMGEREKVQPF